MGVTQQGSQACIQTITDICQAMTEHENVGPRPEPSHTIKGEKYVSQAAAREYYENLLPDLFQFRRVSGAVVAKAIYIDDLKPGDPLVHRDILGNVDVTCLGSLAVASLIIRMTRDGNETGRFRNIRIFLQDAGGGPCRPHMWLNEKIPPAA